MSQTNTNEITGITITYTPPPAINSFVIFADFPIGKVKDAREVEVELYAHTKTRFSVSFQYGQARASANFIPPGSENLKFAEKTSFSHFSGKYSTSHYFVASKKQGLKAMEQHLKNLVREVLGLGENEPFTIKVWENTYLRLLANY